jgi:inner membrane protease subunit 1
MGISSQLRHVSRSGLASLSFTVFSFYCMADLFQKHVYDWGNLSGPSMYPTISSHGTSAFIDRRYRLGRDCKVGDIIEFSNPFQPGRNSAKRIVGMPGDYVVFDEHMASSVGGTKGPWMMDEERERERTEPRMTLVPEGHVWVAGDNMSYSRDSRYFGPLPMALIRGKIDSTLEGRIDWKSFRGDHMVPVPVDEVD